MHITRLTMAKVACRDSFALSYWCAHGAITDESSVREIDDAHLFARIIYRPKKVVFIEIALTLLTVQAFAINWLAGMP